MEFGAASVNKRPYISYLPLWLSKAFFSYFQLSRFIIRVAFKLGTKLESK
jgi:hypothetical protein